MKLDKDFIFLCLKNDMKPEGNKVKVLDSFIVDFEAKTIEGEKIINLNKSHLQTSIVDYINDPGFALLIRYKLLTYSCFVKNENEFEITIHGTDDAYDTLEDLSVEELISDDLNFFFYDSLLKSKDVITSDGDLAAVIDALFGVVTTKKGKNKEYSFVVNGLEITKANLMKMRNSNDPVPAVSGIVFDSCVCENKEFVTNFFVKSTKVIFN